MGLFYHVHPPTDPPTGLSWEGHPDAVALIAADSRWLKRKPIEDAIVTIAEPFDATTPLTNAADIKISGGVVVVERGTVPFGTKALRAEEAGAAQRSN